MDYRADQVFQHAAAVAKNGWKVVRLYGVRDNCTCTCSRGAECPTPGKHPSGNDWQSRATDDESVIAGWFDHLDERMNIGLLLGQASGVIDVEVDTPEAEETLRRFGLDRLATPTYRASRGCHRLFKFTSDLPDVAVVKVDNLEVRIGGGGRSAQSVMPCSWHRTGIQYQWLPGLSPDDVEPVPLPAEFLAAVVANSRIGGSGAISQSIAMVSDGGKASAGGRHGLLLGIASDLARMLPEYTPGRRQWVAEMLHSANISRCDPPKTESEVLRIANDQFDYYRNMQTARQTRVTRPYERFGLEWSDDTKEWLPGSWRVTIVHSHPIEYRLQFPFEGRTISVSIEPEDWQKSHKVSALILAASARIDMDTPHAKQWHEVWCGHRVRIEGGYREVSGLKVKLLENGVDEFPSVDALSWSQHAAFVLSYLRPFTRQEDEEVVLSADGTPKWVLHKNTWKLHIKWHVLCAKAWEASRGGVPGEAQKKLLKAAILAATGETDFAIRQVGDSTGDRQRWVIWTDDHIRALETLTGA